MGDTVEVNQVIVEVETAKAAVELPIPWAGVVTALHAEAGETVDVGRPLISIETGSAAAGAGAPATSALPTSAPPTSAAVAPAAAPAVGSAHEDMVPGLPGEGEAPANGKRQPVLVGYGPRAEGGARRRRRTVPSAQPAFEQPKVEPPAAPEPDPEPEPAAAARGVRVLAKPPVRKLAKTLGVDPRHGHAHRPERNDLARRRRRRGHAGRDCRAQRRKVSPIRRA